MGYTGIIKVAQSEFLKRLGTAGTKKIQSNLASGQLTPKELQGLLTNPVDVPSTFQGPPVKPEETVFGVPESKAMGAAGLTLLSALALAGGGYKITDLLKNIKK